MARNNEAKIFIGCFMKNEQICFPACRRFMASCGAASAFQSIYHAKHVFEEFGDKAALKI